MAAPPESALAAPHSTKAPRPPRIAATDGELLRLFAKRCEQKSPPSGEDPFAQIMDRHQAMVWRVCRGVLHRRQDAEDAFQATFLILAKRARSIHANESAAGWLYRVAHRTALAARRRRRKRRETGLEGEPLVQETALPDLATREMAGVLMEELRRLPSNYQTPLVLRYLEGQSRRAIADQTDSTIAAVQGQIARGKALLRRRLLQRGVSLAAAMAIVATGKAHAESAPPTVLGATTSNATAIAMGSSVAASTVVITLFREGVRAMFVSQVAKPAAAVAIAVACVLLMSAPSISDEALEKAQASRPLALDVEAPAEVAEESPALKIDATNEVASDGPLYPWTRYLPAKLPDGASDTEVERQLKLFAEQIRNSVHPNQWSDEGGDWDVIPYVKERKVIVLAPKRAHDAIGRALEKDGIAKQTQSVAKAGDQVVVFGKTKPGYFGASATGEFIVAGKVDESGKLQFNVPGRAGGKLGGFLDQTTAVSLDVRGKSPAEIQRELAGWLKEHDILAKNKIVDGKWVDEKDLHPVDVTVSRVEFAGDLRVGQPYSKAYKSDKLPLQVMGLIETVANSVSNTRHVVTDWSGKGEIIVHARQDQHDQIELVIKRLEEPSATAAVSAHRFRPGESMRIQVAGALPKQPIDDVYRIEDTGAVALGPIYGRVKLAGMSIPEAEASLKRHLSGILKDPEVQVTNATPAETPTRPTPLNGTVRESWPNGQFRSEREYEDGKIVAAVEYAEDGTTLYEFVDHGTRTETNSKDPASTKLSPAEQSEKLFAEVELMVKQAEGHLALAKEMIESGGAMSEVNDFVRARADQARSFASTAERKLNEVINNSVAAESRSDNAAVSENTLLERVRPLSQRISTADSQAAQYQTRETVLRMVQAAQAKREDKAAAKLREEEPPQELDLDERLSQIRELIDKAEAGADKAEKMALFALGSDGQSGVIQRVFFKQAKNAASDANGSASRAEKMLEEMVVSVVRSGTSGEAQIAPEALSELQTKVAPLANRLQAVGTRIGSAYSIDRLGGDSLKEYLGHLERIRNSEAEPASE